MMMQERTDKNDVREILFDEAVAPQVEHDWFVPDFWRKRGALRTQAGGRGGVAIIATAVGDCVLRHYRRGGLVARLLGDRYLWTGPSRTRPFREFRLLAEIDRLGLPGPVGVAARYVRHGLFYSADLITRRIADARTLAECLVEQRLDGDLAAAVGVLIARFHRAGIWHADLNAHNVLVTPENVYLIDFDRGCQRKPAAAWQQANLQRLRRSLRKLGAEDKGTAAFEHTFWQPLLHHYHQALNA